MGKSWAAVGAAGVVGVVIGVAATMTFEHSGSGVATTASTTVTEQAPPQDCGPDQEAALGAAFAKVVPEPNTGRGWSPIPTASNYGPCADLSTTLVTVDGGTGSSPIQALLFHRGRYVGPATPVAYGFTGLDAAASTDDTVVLTYRTGQSCTACGDGTVSTVRYRWADDAVRRLDPLPAG